MCLGHVLGVGWGSHGCRLGKHIRPGCGGLHGTPDESERFGEVFNKIVGRWEARLMRHEWARALITKYPVCGKAVDLAITAFVDHLFRRILCNEVEQLEERMVVMDKYIDEEMAKDDNKQNDKTKNVGVKFYGEGAVEKTERVYKRGVPVSGKIVKTVRYLGPTRA